MCISGKVALDMENNMLRKDNKIKFGGCFQILMIHVTLIGQRITLAQNTLLRFPLLPKESYFVCVY